MKITIWLPLFLLAFIACSPAPEGVQFHDPYEAQNRAAHNFNKRIASAIGGEDDPTAQESGPRIPPDVATAAINFADHVGLPGVILNNMLQGDVPGAASNATRFLINTVFGVVGIFDPATQSGLPEVETDFGGTLAVWGAPEGAYLELPLLGPTTERDLGGDIVDFVIDPLGQFLTTDQRTIATLGSIAGRIAKIDQAGDVIGDVLNESADSYDQARLIYLQNRRFELDIDDSADIDPYADLFEDGEF